jgi:hypothetical protein
MPGLAGPGTNGWEEDGVAALASDLTGTNMRRQVAPMTTRETLIAGLTPLCRPRP